MLLLHDVVIPCYLTISCVSFYIYIFISYELLALSLMLYPDVDQWNLQTNEKIAPFLSQSDLKKDKASLNIKF